ncbi:MAG: hemolysin III family protein [Clostridia bacterium]|nr:hemolysin III family protein [Clostridia bacterium]
MVSKRIRLKDRILPDYTKGEEIFNMVTHIVGGALGVVTLVFCILLPALEGSTAGVLCGIMFGVSMTLLYTMSSIYHGLRRGTAKKVFQIMDHCSIYWLIAGTYTPILVCSVAKNYPIAAWTTFALVWGLAILATTLTAIDLRKYKVFSMICYIGMGWAVVFSMKQTYLSLGHEGFMGVLFGGILYTLGVFFFVKRRRYFHSVFHIFVVLGSLCHSVAVIFYVI